MADRREPEETQALSAAILKVKVLTESGAWEMRWLTFPTLDDAIGWLALDAFEEYEFINMQIQGHEFVAQALGE